MNNISDYETFAYDRSTCPTLQDVAIGDQWRRNAGRVWAVDPCTGVGDFIVVGDAYARRVDEHSDWEPAASRPDSG